MTGAGSPDRAVSDPVGLITELVGAAEEGLGVERIRAVVNEVAGGRAKSRRLAAALAGRPAVLADGRSPAPLVAGELLLALRAAGARSVSPPCCAGCGRPLGSLQRRGQDWYCAACVTTRPQPCAGCGNDLPVASRDRSGRPRCRRCPDSDDRDPITVIHTLTTRLDPQAGRDIVAAAVRAAAPGPSYQQKLAWALEQQPELLTGQGHLAPLRAIPRLIDGLHAAGVAGIVRPSCPVCHRQVRIDKPLHGVRVCRMCIAHSRVQPCARCAARREPVTRDGQGKPLCANCFITDEANLETCVGCGRRRPVSRRVPGGPLCPSCPTLPPAICSICGKNTPCGRSRVTGLPWCPTCQRRTATCSACGRHAPITSGTLHEPRCSTCTAAPTWSTCPTCNDPDQPHPGSCARCLINTHLDQVLGPDTTRLPPGLQALRSNLATTSNPGTAMRWLTNPTTAPVLSGLADGSISMSHQALDDLPASQPMAHLRQTLVAVGALPERDENMIRLEAFVDQLLADQTDPDRRQLLRRYLTWHLLRRLRSRNDRDGRATTLQQSMMVRRLGRGAIAFLDWLAAHHLTLQTCRQSDLDRWAVDEKAIYRQETGRLIRWARANKLTGCHLPSTRWTGPARPLDHQHRWDTARRLLHDDTIKPEDRLAGLLVLLYAQQTAAISRMTVDQIQDGTTEVTIRLGRAPIQLPEPVAALARTMLANRKGHATIGAASPSTWLFPGGQPGRPISSAQLTHRLNAIDVRPSPDRSTALFQLATEVPAAILARTLGIHTDVAVTWQRHSAGDWTTYAADLHRREPRADPSS